MMDYVNHMQALNKQTPFASILCSPFGHIECYLTLVTKPFGHIECYLTLVTKPKKYIKQLEPWWSYVQRTLTFRARIPQTSTPITNRAITLPHAAVSQVLINIATKVSETSTELITFLQQMKKLQTKQFCLPRYKDNFAFSIFIFSFSFCLSRQNYFASVPLQVLLPRSSQGVIQLHSTHPINRAKQAYTYCCIPLLAPQLLFL